MSDFKPVPAATGYGRFKNLPHWHVPRERSDEPGPSHSFNFPPEQQQQQQQHSATIEEEEEDEEMPDAHRESSADPIDFLGQEADALIAHSFEQLAEHEDAFLSLQQALEFAFNASSEKRLPSEPEHWRDISGRPDAEKWHNAALEEFSALLETGTFEPVQLPPGRKAIGCRWVFKLKRKADGSIDRYKARLVAKGFAQRPGLDFGQVFAPTARWAALRAIFALAAIEDMEMYSLDISNAFLNGELDHEVYMQQPEGFTNRYGTGFVLKLNRALYGLKQAGHQWHKKLDSVMSAMEFKLVRCDNSIWVYKRDQSHIIVPVYVDDMTVVCKSPAEYTSIVSELKQHFKLKELGPSSSLLAVAIGRDRSKRLLTLSQQQFIEDVLERFGMSDCHPVTTPLDPGARLSKKQATRDDAERKQMQTRP